MLHVLIKFLTILHVFQVFYQLLRCEMTHDVVCVAGHATFLFPPVRHIQIVSTRTSYTGDLYDLKLYRRSARGHNSYTA